VLITASSFNTKEDFLYGTFSTGLQFNPLATDDSQRVACVEFRCPVIPAYANEPENTVVHGNITVPGKPNGCCEVKYDLYNHFFCEKENYHQIIVS